MKRRYGRWTIVGDEYRDHHGIRYVPVRCDCGFEGCVSVRTLIVGASKSCGCWRREKLRKLHTTHGQSRGRSRLYWVWAGMIQRCTNPKTIGFKNYGGRGIKVCWKWRKFETFQAWAKIAGYRSGLQIDRIKVDGNYCPSNCRWVSRLIQMNNRRRSKWEGTSFHSATGKYQAYVDYGLPGERKRKYLGLYVTRVKAKQAVENWRQRRVAQCRGAQTMQSSVGSSPTPPLLP